MTGRTLASTIAWFPGGATAVGILKSCILPLLLQVGSLGLWDHLPWPEGWHHEYDLCCFISSSSYWTGQGGIKLQRLLKVQDRCP